MAPEVTVAVVTRGGGYEESRRRREHSAPQIALPCWALGAVGGVRRAHAKRVFPHSPT